MRNRMVNRARRAFTLIEILIVVVILGILAAIVIPQFTEASDDAARSSVRSTLQVLRSQHELYKFKSGAPPSSVSVLVTEGYLQADPTTNQPSGYAIVHDTTNNDYHATCPASTDCTAW
jgi:general secretion pathway protein G